MKQLSAFTFLAFFLLLGCSRTDSIPDSSATTPTLQAGAPAYDPFSDESVILHSHPVYGQMVLDDMGNGLTLAGDIQIVWDGPWMDNPHPWKPLIVGLCENMMMVCFVLVTGPATLGPVFQAEGLDITDYSNPALLIRAYENHSTMVLVDNFGDDPTTGNHTAEIIKEL